MWKPTFCLLAGVEVEDLAASVLVMREVNMLSLAAFARVPNVVEAYFILILRPNIELLRWSLIV